MKTQTKLASFIIIIAVALLAGCSGPPSESTGRAMLQHQIEKESGGKIQLVSFRKTNATGNDSNYSLEYEVEIQFLATGAWASGNAIDQSPSFGFSTQQVGQNPMGQLIGSLDGSKNVQQGQRTTVKGTLQFNKTEKGWRGQDGNVY